MNAELRPPPKQLPAERFAIDPFAIEGQVDFAQIFGNGNPVELEVGCGKGGFLLRQARDHPDRNYVGVEWANKYYKYAADRMYRWQVRNARLVRTDARDFIKNQTPTGSLHAVHVYHPDPWPKSRHQKRRLFTDEFVGQLARVLVPGGRIAVQTDYADYFKIIRDLLAACRELESCDFADAEYGTPHQRTDTNFEVKYLREGRTIHRLAFRRRGQPT
jgi:tRNA (guanine-N7-)-methyltransferase